MLVVRNLLSDYSELVALLRGQLEAARDGDAEDVLDAFLLAAGANQVVEDYLHRDLLGLGKAAEVLPSPLGGVARGAHAACAALRLERRIRRHQRELAELTDRLADAVTGSQAPPLAVPELRRVPHGLAREVVRLPNCFRSFDQHPDDCRRLAELYAARGAQADRPLLVLGLRTSGSYLAPLTASFLRAAGFEQVETMTFRPGRRWLGAERRRLRGFGRAGGTVLLIDDPPRTGVQMRRAADELASLGLESVVLLVPTLAPGLPEPLAGLDVVQLPWEDWSIHGRLPHVEVPVEREAAERSHASAVARVGDEHVLARGVGLGYFGRHVLAIAEALGEFLPRIHGLEEGVLSREWLPDEDRLRPEQAADPPVVRTLAAYAAARLERLPVGEDVSTRLVGRDALWEHVASLLGRAFGKLRLPFRRTLHRSAKRLVRVPQPAVPDGSMHLTSWFDGPTLRKVEFEERSFAASGLTLYNFDPVFDLATAASETGEDAAGLLLAEYESQTGTEVSSERWLLYRLLRMHIARRRALREATDETAARLLGLEQAMARAHRDYMSRLFFADVEAPATGPLCAIDIDGVLETRWLAYSALGPSGAVALRALIRHGYRPALVTGRSLADVRERCAAYRIPAGVAEYGAALSDGTSLVPDESRSGLEALRERLRSSPGVYVDPGYTYGVRAYDARGGGPIAAVADDEVRVIQGELQTDFAAAGVDKGSGLAALAGGERIALAVGDSSSDLPMLALAERAFAPSNAGRMVREAGAKITRAPYQAGLAAAVGALIGHRPGSCERCRPPELSLDSRLFMHVLAAHDAGRWGKLRHGLALARLARKAA